MPSRKNTVREANPARRASARGRRRGVRADGPLFQESSQAREPLEAARVSGQLRPVACVSLPELPLQLLLRRNPRWRDRPVALVAEERPEEPLRLINARARQACLRTGMRFGAAKSLVPELCAGSVSDLEQEQACCELVQVLQTFSPHVERDPVLIGVFYLDPTGLDSLYGGVRSWARSVHRFVRGKGYYGSLVVGFGRTLTYALAQVCRDVRVLQEEAEVHACAGAVPLERLGMSPRLRDGLLRLGLTRLGDLATLGADALQTRFSAEAAQWCRVAQGYEVLPLCAEPHAEAVRVEVTVDPPDTDVARLCFILKRALHQLFDQLVPRGQSAAVLWLTLKLERGAPRRERLEPARPSREASLWLELLRLRLDSLTLEGPVEEVCLEVDGVRTQPGQQALFPTGRDLAAGDRALARIRALFGEQSVLRAHLREGHLPEASYRFEALTALSEPSVPAPRASPVPLVRRLHRRPEALTAKLEFPAATSRHPFQARLRHRGELWKLTGPYCVSGGWWVRQVTRDYYYAEDGSGRLRWVFYDRERRGWFEHAWVD